MPVAKHQKPYKTMTRISSLLGEDTLTSPSSQTLLTESIQMLPQQPRRYFAPTLMQELVESVKQHGILQPLLVRPISENRYELVAGERRYRAALDAGLTEVPVQIKKMTEQEAVTFSLVENLQRENLNPLEETEGILQLLKIELNASLPEITSILYRMYKAKSQNQNGYGNVTIPQAQAVEEVFASINKGSWTGFVRNKLPLLNLPHHILDALREGKLEYTKARALAKIKNEQHRKGLLDEAISQDLSLSQIKERIQLLQSQAIEPTTPQRTLDATIRRLREAKPWKNPQKWKKVQTLLKKLETLIEEEG